MAIRDFVFLAICCLIPLYLGGCCCSCGGRFPPANFNVNDGTSVDPDETEEEKEAREYATMALSKAGYGAPKTVTLQKDGVNWYTTGMVEDGGKDVSYIVWFEVTTHETEYNVKTTWAAKQVTVDDVVVYP